jgi:hypothetical protein
MKYIIKNEEVLVLDYIEGQYQARFNSVGIGETKVYAETVKSKLKAEMTVKVVLKTKPQRTEFYGSGTEIDPYRIDEKQDLLLLREKTERYAERYENKLYQQNIFTDKYFILTNDIEIDAEEWNQNINKFDGIFDGNGKKIDININGYGIFDTLSANAVVKNLYVYADIDVSINPTEWDYVKFVGILAGSNEGLIENCMTSGSIYNGKDEYDGVWAMGGIVGENYGIIRNCISDADIMQTYYDSVEFMVRPFVGGLVGRNYSKDSKNVITSLNNCTFIGTVKVQWDTSPYGCEVGALIGQNINYPEAYTTRNIYYDINSLDGRTADEIDVLYIPRGAIVVRNYVNCSEEFSRNFANASAEFNRFASKGVDNSDKTRTKTETKKRHITDLY